MHISQWPVTLEWASISVDHVGRAVSIGGLQWEHHLPGTVECKVLVGRGGAGDVAA
ncbi:MAG: hypothetical protein ACR2M4_05405 [Actinomycetota bacterium]